MIEVDELKMYFGYEYEVNSGIIMISPKVKQIVEFGEDEYFSAVHYLTCIPSDMISTLWDMGIDWEQIDDFELFIMLTRTLTKEQLSLIFKDLDLSLMDIQINEENGEVVLRNEATNQTIDRLAYTKISNYLRKMHGLEPKIKHAKNKDTKNVLIEVDRQDKRKAAKDAEKQGSQLLPLISAMMRYPGFKYKSSELMECTLFEFMDTVRGASVYISSTSLLQGSYSGFCDTSKIDKKNFDWMRRG